MDIAIIEYEGDIDCALESGKFSRGLFLSVSAEASYHLSKRGIPFITEEDILTPEEFQALGYENFALTEKWVESLEARLRSFDPKFEERRFQPFQWHFYRIKILVDAVRVRTELIERLIQKEKPGRIGLPFGAQPSNIHDHHLFFHKYDSLYGLLGRQLSSANGIPFVQWRRPRRPSLFRVLPDRLRNSAGELVRLAVSLRPLKDAVQRRGKRRNLLFGTLGYDLGPLKERLSRNFDIFSYEPPSGVRPLTAAAPFFKSDRKSPFPGFRDDLVANIQISGNSAADGILNQRMKKYIDVYLPALWKGLEDLESADRRNAFRAYFHSAGASDCFYGLPVHYFMNHGKPVFIIQHGAYGIAPNKITEYCEFAHDGYFLSWGEGISEMYNHRKKGRCSIIPAGSHLIDGIGKKPGRRDVIREICYISGSYRGYTAHYPNGQSCLDSRLFLMEIGFLSALKPYLKKYMFTYKIAPGARRESPIWGYSPSLDWVKANMPGMKIDSRPLMSIIHDYDLFVIDWPTTALVQATASSAGILIYVGNPYHRITANALALLSRRATLGLDEEDFVAKIRKVLDEGSLTYDEDDGFLRCYGTYMNDGASLERMAEHVMDHCR